MSKQQSLLKIFICNQRISLLIQQFYFKVILLMEGLMVLYFKVTFLSTLNSFNCHGVIFYVKFLIELCMTNEHLILNFYNVSKLVLKWLRD